MSINQGIIDFIHCLDYQEIPDDVKGITRLLCLDLIAVAAAGRLTKLSEITQRYACEEMPGNHAILFSNQTASSSGSAYANAAMIDSFDAHDGHVLCKGHIGVTILPVIIACYGDITKVNVDSNFGKEIITSLVIGYELGSRLGIALHQSTSDYHTSGAWNAIAGAAIAARAMKLNPNQTLHALGIAEFYGPRSPMMRCIDYPTMLKDGSSMGAFVAISSAIQAKYGFTGAPAMTVFEENNEKLFQDLKHNWFTAEQYFKYYPVCRWAQPSIEAALVLSEREHFTIENIEFITIQTFHQAKRLFNSVPKTTEQAQYGLSMPFACALINKCISAEQIIHDFDNPIYVNLIEKIKIEELDRFNKVFPAQRWANVVIHYKDGSKIESGDCRTKGDYDTPYSNEELITKATNLLKNQMSDNQVKQVIQTCLNLGLE